MKHSEVFEFLSDPDNMAYFLAFFNEGIWDEWDTGLPNALEQFGPEEIALAAKTAHVVAKHYELETN